MTMVPVRSANFANVTLQDGTTVVGATPVMLDNGSQNFQLGIQQSKIVEVSNTAYEIIMALANVQQQSQLVGSNAISATAVVPNDAANLTKTPTKGLYVGVGGDVKVDMSDGSTVTFTALASGIVHPLAVKKVYATGTTAGNITAVY